MHIEITIHCPELAKLADAIQAKATPALDARTQTEVAVTPAVTATVPAPTVAPTEAPKYTLDDLTKAGAGLAQAGKMDALLALLTQYGVQAVTQIPPEQYGAFATALRGLGAAL